MFDFAQSHEQEKYLEQRAAMEYTLANREKLAEFNEVDQLTGATINERYSGQIVGRWLRGIVVNQMQMGGEEPGQQSGVDFIHNT